MKKQKENISNGLQGFMKKAPVLSVPNALGMNPNEHERNLYYYTFTQYGKEYSLCVNNERQQWCVDKQHQGDDAASLASLLATANDNQFNGFSMFDAVAMRIIMDLKKSQETPQRITFKPLPINDGTWVAKRYDEAINRPFLQGLCEATLKKQCYVVYSANCPAGEEDEETKRLFNLMLATKDLNDLSQEDKIAIKQNYSTAIALRNVNEGLQLYTGEFSYPEYREGYCLIGGEDVGIGETLYVYENIMDYLALMEQRHANCVDAIMPPAHHLIINGETNMPEALAYIHTRCDYLRVVCMFPNDKEGHALFEKVNKAACNTAEDASQRLYADKNYFSLYAKTADIFGYADREACERELEQWTIGK